VIEAAAAEPWWSDMRTLAILFGLDTGMRPGEVYGVRKRDVDRARARVQIHQTVIKLRGERPKVKPNHAKNRPSKAPVDLGDLGMAVLVRAAALQQQQMQLAGDAWEDHNQLVFTNSLGGPLDEQQVRRWSDKLLEAAGVTRIPVKNVRHTHATLLIEEGLDLKSVSARLRHSRTKRDGQHLRACHAADADQSAGDSQPCVPCSRSVCERIYCHFIARGRDGGSVIRTVVRNSNSTYWRRRPDSNR